MVSQKQADSHISGPIRFCNRFVNVAYESSYYAAPTVGTRVGWYLSWHLTHACICDNVTLLVRKWECGRKLLRSYSTAPTANGNRIIQLRLPNVVLERHIMGQPVGWCPLAEVSACKMCRNCDAWRRLSSTWWKRPWRPQNVRIWPLRPQHKTEIVLIYATWRNFQ